MREKSKSRKLPIPKSDLDARPDTVDFRDKMYVATLVEVPSHVPLETYRGYYQKGKVPVLDQGNEGACTGFGLAAVANFLLRRRKVVPDATLVSPRMMYEMARRYDEWPGERYSGSSARGAMKGWHRHGVCSRRHWPDAAKDHAETLHHDRATDAASRPLGAYFRVNHQSLRDMHSALAEVGILYATATVHDGWEEIDPRSGLIAGPSKKVLGGHAFAIVGYDERGFWIQNSWGTNWGKGGFASLSYDDWLANGTDVWVARLGAPTLLTVVDDRTQAAIAVGRSEFAFADLRPHVISIGNNGGLRDSGMFATKQTDIDRIFSEDFARITASWRTKRILLYAHGGLVSESAALQRVEDYRAQLLDAQIYPVAFIWKTDAWTTLVNVLEDALSLRRPEGLLDSAKDFMLDRLDDTLEPLARPLGKTMWDEMKQNARLATESDQGGARAVLARLNQLLSSDSKIEIHVAGHSAGGIFMAYLLHRWTTDLNRILASVTLWAPACTMALFKSTYLPALRDGKVGRFSLFTLKDQAERDDDCGGIYHKSLLYLVSNAFEEKHGLLFADGEAILGMERFILSDRVFKVNPAAVRQDNPSRVRLFGRADAEWIRSPNGLGAGNASAAEARHHGDFDDDRATVLATLARILGRTKSDAAFDFKSSSAALGDRRRKLALR